jgi:integrase
VHPSPAEDRAVKKRWRRPSLQHPLAPSFVRALESICTALSPATLRNYEFAVRSFLIYLGAEHPKVSGLEQLHRDPHTLGWMARMRAQTPPLATPTCIGRLIALRAVLNELAWTHKVAELAHMIRREDIPRTPQNLPRPLTAEQDHLLQLELMDRNDLAGNIFLLLRHTGMRIGECVDLSYDCLHSVSPNQWAIHVPLGKLKTERMVPVDAFVRDIVHRLRFFRSLDPLPDNGRLLAWHGSRVSLLARLRDYLHLACHSAGLPTNIVPHQLRHTYGTEMLRAGVGFAAVMKLLGHTNPGMTMRYVDVTLTDLQREFQLARSQPRHLAPQPKTSSAPLRTGRDGLIDSLIVAQNLMLAVRRSLPNGDAHTHLDRLANRLTKILAEIRKLQIN